jgi:hypothetical protein
MVPKRHERRLQQQGNALKDKRLSPFLNGTEAVRGTRYSFVYQFFTQIFFPIFS